MSRTTFWTSFDPSELATAGDYAARARPILREIASRGALPIVVGGTGFYLRALLDGLADGPSRNEPLRRRLSRMESRQAGRLHRLLRRLDAEAAARIHARDLNKLIRALEICILSRRPASHVFRDGNVPLEGFKTLKIVLEPERKALHERIAVRTRQIFAAGLLDEVRELVAHGVSMDAKPFESIGYREATEFLRGRMSLEQAIEAATIATRQYAKRQITWFRRESGAVVVRGFGDDPFILDELTKITTWIPGQFTRVNVTCNVYVSVSLLFTSDRCSCLKTNGNGARQISTTKKWWSYRHNRRK